MFVSKEQRVLDKKNKKRALEMISGETKDEAARDIFLFPLPSVIFPNQVLHFVQD